MAIKFELKELKTGESIDVAGKKLAADLNQLRNEIDAKRKDLEQKATLTDAQTFLDAVPMKYDASKHILQIGDSYLQATSQEEFDSYLSTIKNDISKSNEQLIELNVKYASAKTQLEKEIKENQADVSLKLLQDVISQQKATEAKITNFLATNSPEGSQEDVKKMFELVHKLDGAMTSNKALLASAMSAGSIEALKEQNTYLQGIVNGYEKYGAKFDIKNFKDKNQQRISGDLQNLYTQFGVPTPFGTTSTTETSSRTLSAYEYNVQQNNNERGIERGADGVPTFATMNDVRAYLDAHPAQDEEEWHYTRREKKAMRLTDRMDDANTEERREQLAKKLSRLQTRKRKHEEKTRDYMAKASANTIAAHEAKNQTWYYNDIIANITKKNNRTYYSGENLIIDTYNPLFRMNGLNERGTIRIKCNPNDPNSIVATAMNYASGSDEFLKNNPDFCTPKGDMKWLLEAGTDLLADKTNMTPKQADFWKSAAKMGSVVGLAVVGWNVLKWIFGKAGKTKVFGRTKAEWDTWKWIAGTVWGTMAMQALTGENPMSFTYKLLNGGLDSKQFEKIPGIQWFLNSMKRNPELSDHLKSGTGMAMLFPGNSFGEVMTHGDVVKWESEGKISSNKKALINYYNAKISDPLTPPANRESFQIALASVQNMTDQQLHTLLTGGMNAAGVTNKTSAEKIQDYNKTWQEYMKEQEKAAREIKDPTIKLLMGAYASQETKDILKLNGSRELTEDEAVNLQLALMKVKEKDPNAKIIFTKEHGIILSTSNGDIPVKLTIDGKWQVAWFENALFTNPEHALRIWALTAFFINHFKGRLPSDATNPWAVNGGDVTFGDNDKRGWINGRIRKNGGWVFSALTSMIPGSSTEALDGDDWKYVPWTKSSMKEMWWDLFESQIGAYATYLNGLKNNSGKSIWTADGNITTTADVAGFIPTLKQLPAPSNTNAPDNKKADDDHTDNTPDNKKPSSDKLKSDSLIGPKTDTDKLKDAIKDADADKADKVIDQNDKADEKMIKERAATWKKEFDPYYVKQIKKEMPLEFYEAWSEAYGKDGNYKLQFMFDNTPYWRQWGNLPPTRHLPKAQKTWGIWNVK